MSINDRNLKSIFIQKSAELEYLGYTVFENAINHDECDNFKKLIDEWLDEKATAGDFVDDSRFKYIAIPDTLSKDHFFDMSKVFQARNLIDFLRFHCKEEIMYLDHFDAHRNLSSGWHEDTNQKHFKQGNNHSNINLFDPNYKVYRICFYLQDHDEDFCGLHVRPCSHRYPKDKHSLFNNDIPLGTKKGDMIIFDCRLSHKGVVYNNSEMKKNNKNRHTIFLCVGAKNNIYSETHRMGAVQRQNKQLKRSDYRINPKLSEHLKNLGVCVFEEDSVFYK